MGKNSGIKIDTSKCKNKLSTNETGIDGMIMSPIGEDWKILKFFRHENSEKSFKSW